jgi:hypothetical protein
MNTNIYEVNLKKEQEDEDEMKNNEELEGSKRFYIDLKEYHNKTLPILKLITDYFNSVNREYYKEYVSFRMEDYKLVDSTLKWKEKVSDKIEVWYSSDNRKEDEIDDSIFEIEFDGKIYFFKVFDYGSGNSVLSGYCLEDSTSVRSFISSLNEEKIKEKYERILNLF